MKKLNQKLNKIYQKIDFLSVPTSEGYEMISLAEVAFLEADNTYTIFHYEDKSKLISTKNLGYYEKELFDEPFLRVHQSFMVNLNQVKRYVRADNGFIILRNGDIVKVSRGRKDNLLAFFQMRRFSNTASKRQPTDK